MRYHRGLIAERIVTRPVVFALGGFDGVHRGHHHLFSLGQRLAKEREALFTVLTFSPHPRQLLFPDEPPSCLTSPVHKYQLLDDAGVDLLIEIPFSKELMAMEALRFVKAIEAMVPIDTWIGGRDLRFGRNQEGGCRLLEDRAVETGMKTLFFDRIEAFEENISSTRIRSLVMCGALSQAEALLGRPYSLMAPCTVSNTSESDHQRTTFSIDASLLCLPPDGVYAARVRLGKGGSSYDAQLHIAHGEGSISRCEVLIDAPSVPAEDFIEVAPGALLSAL